MTILNYQSPFTGQEIDVYLAKAATALQADTGVLLSSVDDVPVDGATMAPISSNWAYDHAAGLGGHVFTQYGFDDAGASQTEEGVLGLDHEAALTGQVSTTAGVVAEHAHD